MDDLHSMGLMTTVEERADALKWAETILREASADATVDAQHAAYNLREFIEDLNRSVVRAEAAEAAEASLQDATAEALEALGSARIRISALETLVLSCCDHDLMDDADEMLFEDILDRRSGRSLKTAPHDSEEKAA